MFYHIYVAFHVNFFLYCNPLRIYCKNHKEGLVSDGKADTSEKSIPNMTLICKWQNCMKKRQI